MCNFTLSLAAFSEKLNYPDLPDQVVKEAKRRILDVIGAGLSGFTSEAGQNIVKFVNENNNTSNGKSTIWGSGNKVSAEYAALANGTMTFHLELDDVHRTSHTHPGVSTIPAALALCEELNLSGEELITAIVLGYEIGIRIGIALSPSIYIDRPFLAPGILSIFSSASAASKLFNFNKSEIVGIIGSAAYLSPVSPFETFKRGFSMKDCIMGWGGLTGILSAKMRHFEFEGADTGIEGDFGFARVAAKNYDFNRGLSGLGEDFAILNTGIKPYACCRQHHAAIDATLEIRQKFNPDVRNIEKIIDHTFSVSSRGNNPIPKTIAEAKYSNPYIIAVVLLEGKANREQFTPEKIHNRDILSLAEKVEVIADPELDKLYDEKWPSIVEMKMNDGSIYSARKDIPKGEPEYPLTDQELKEKFISLSTDTISLEKAEKIWEIVMNIEKLDTIFELSSLLCK